MITTSSFAGKQPSKPTPNAPASIVKKAVEPITVVPPMPPPPVYPPDVTYPPSKPGVAGPTSHKTSRTAPVSAKR